MGDKFSFDDLIKKGYTVNPDTGQWEPPVKSGTFSALKNMVDEPDSKMSMKFIELKPGQYHEESGLFQRCADAICTKPNCNCAEIAISKAGHEVKSYPCLASSANDYKEKTNIDRLPFPQLVAEMAKYYENVPLVNEFTIFDIAPMGKPRMTIGDRANYRPIVQKYWAFKSALQKMCADEKFILSNRFEIIFQFEIKKGNKKKYKFGEAHEKHPDLDNCLKAVMDCLMKQDSTVSKVIMQKQWYNRSAILIRNLP